MPRNVKDRQLLQDIMRVVQAGNMTVDECWLAIDRRVSRSTVKNYLDDMVKLGALSVNREYTSHRYVPAGGLSDIMPELEYYLPKVEEYRAQKVPMVVNHCVKAYDANPDVKPIVYPREKIFVMLALAARSEDPNQLQRLVTEAAKLLHTSFMDYRLFDTISKRGIDKTKDAKDLFNLGNMNAHESALLFNQMFAEVFSQSPQTNA